MPPARGGKSLVTSNVRRTTGPTLLRVSRDQIAGRPPGSRPAICRLRRAGARVSRGRGDRSGSGRPRDAGDVDRAGLGRGVDDLAVADVHRDVADRRVVGDQVTRLQLAQRDRRQPACPPEVRGMRHAGLRPGPRRQAGAVEGVRAGGAVDVGRADLGQRRRHRDRAGCWRGRSAAAAGASWPRLLRAERWTRPACCGPRRDRRAAPHWSRRSVAAGAAAAAACCWPARPRRRRPAAAPRRPLRPRPAAVPPPRPGRARRPHGILPLLLGERVVQLLVRGGLGGQVGLPLRDVGGLLLRGGLRGVGVGLRLLGGVCGGVRVGLACWRRSWRRALRPGSAGCRRRPGQRS